MRKKSKEKKNKVGIIQNEPQEELETGLPADALELQERYAEVLNFERKQRSNLLGSFKGEEYGINDARVLESLLSIAKKYEVQDDDTVYLSTKLGAFVLNYKIVLDVSYPLCSARLYLIEIEQGVEDIKHLTELDRVDETYSANFRTKVLEKWHVYYEDEEDVKDDYLYSVLHLQREEYLFNRELMAILSQLYLLRMLRALDNCGEAGEIIQLEYKMLVEKYMETHPDITQDFAMQKVLFDSVLKRFNGMDVILKSEEGKKVLREYTTPVKNLKDKNYRDLTESLSKKEEKPVEKTSTTKKPIAKGGSSWIKNVTKPVPKVDWSKLFGTIAAAGVSPVIPVIILPTPRRMEEPTHTHTPETPSPSREFPTPEPSTPTEEGLTEEEIEARGNFIDLLGKEDENVVNPPKDRDKETVETLGENPEERVESLDGGGAELVKSPGDGREGLKVDHIR